MTLIVDASVALAWVFEDEKAPVADEVLRRVVAEGAYAPSLWKLEIANVLWASVRRKRCDERYAKRSLEHLERLQVMIDQETELHAWGQTRVLSVKFDVSVYDATYLELALRRSATLATLDKALANAGQRAGLEVMCD
ncbi:MAG: PIN domain-containing protein [Rhodospirillaceae bacterium]|nr:MAG: PIN domain-containing protein [Rhodospirillaceae bacterium]